MMVATFQSSVQWVEIGLLAATVVVVKSVARYMTDSSFMEVPMNGIIKSVAGSG